jgi:hypothetical protein
MTQVEVNKWIAIADDVENNARIDRDLREMAQRSLRVGAVVAIIEVCTPFAVVEDADV